MSQLKVPMIEGEALSDTSDAELRGALAAYLAGDPAEVLKRLDAAGNEDEVDVAGRTVLRALSLRKSARQRDALTLLEGADTDGLRGADVLTARALCHRDFGERETARDLLRRAYAADPSHPAATYYLAVVEQEMGDAARAVELFSEFVDTEAGRGHSLAHSLRGTALRSLERYDESVQSIEQAIAIAPDDIPTRNALVITHYKAGDEQAAVEAGRIALQMKDDLATARFAELNLGVALTPRDAPFDPTDRNKNLIAFSLWGDDPVYTHGAIVNAQLGPHVYPGWRCRFYCDDSVPIPIMDELRRLGAEVHMIRDKALLGMKALWRFLAADDAKADRFICRDTDSRLNVQEALAVDAWIKSGKPFHVMRDHPYHMEVMLAGMWGGVTRVLPNVRELSRVVAGFSPNRWNDQEFLRDVVWPLVRDHTLAHDSVYAFRGGIDFADACRLVGKVHVGGAIKSMPPWPNPAWFADKRSEAGQN